MKKVLCIFVSMVLIGCSITPEKVAHRLVRDYVRRNMNDPATYESVWFGSLDTVNLSSRLCRELYDSACDFYLTVTLNASDPRYELLYKSVFGDIVATPKRRFLNECSMFNYVKNRRCEISAVEAMNEVFGFDVPSKLTMNCISRIDSIQSEIRASSYGLCMQHMYRSMGSSRAKRIHNAVFYFDRNLTRIDSVKMLKVAKL